MTSESSLSRKLMLGLWIAAATLLLGAMFTACMFLPIPKDLNLSLDRPTDKGIYHTTITPQTRALKVNQMHTWSITVRSKDGSPVEHATINIDGGMPQHGHGLPTAPRVTRETAPGTYLVEGMKFSMTGWWVLGVGVRSAHGWDTITYNVVMKEEGV
jgi:hypothetical protein